jgi:hypothetical protein
MSEELGRLTMDELSAEGGTLLPNKEVLSLLDLLVDLDLALDLAAPIDLAVAANANIAAPINAAVGANVLSPLSTAGAVADQSVAVDQAISGEAIANAPQTSVIDQGNDVIDGGTTETGTDGSTLPVATDTGGSTTDLTDPTQVDPTQVDPSALLDDALLRVDVNAALDADVAAPVAGAVAANANAALPINGSVSANVLSPGSEAVSVATQDGTITQNLDDVTAEATAEQDSTLNQ